MFTINLNMLGKLSEGGAIKERTRTEATKTGEEKPTEATKTREEKPTEATKTRERKPTEATKTGEEKPTEVTKTREKKPTEATKTREEMPTEATKTREEKPTEATKTRERKPTEATKTGEEKPTEATKTREGKPTETTKTREGKPTEGTKTREEGKVERGSLRTTAASRTDEKKTTTAKRDGSGGRTRPERTTAAPGGKVTETDDEKVGGGKGGSETESDGKETGKSGGGKRGNETESDGESGRKGGGGKRGNETESDGESERKNGGGKRGNETESDGEDAGKGGGGKRGNETESDGENGGKGGGGKRGNEAGSDEEKGGKGGGGKRRNETESDEEKGGKGGGGKRGNDTESDEEKGGKGKPEGGKGGNETKDGGEGDKGKPKGGKGGKDETKGGGKDDEGKPEGGKGGKDETKGGDKDDKGKPEGGKGGKNETKGGGKDDKGKPDDKEQEEEDELEFTAAKYHEMGLPFHCDRDEIQPKDPLSAYFESIGDKFGKDFKERFTAAAKKGADEWKKAAGNTEAEKKALDDTVKAVQENIKGGQPPLNKLTLAQLKLIPVMCILQADLGADMDLDKVEYLVNDLAMYDVAIKAVAALSSAKYADYAGKVKRYCADPNFPDYLLSGVIDVAARKRPGLLAELRKQIGKDDTGLACRCLNDMVASIASIARGKGRKGMVKSKGKKAGIGKKGGKDRSKRKAGQQITLAEDGMNRLSKCYKMSPEDQRRLLKLAVLHSMGKGGKFTKDNWDTCSWTIPYLSRKELKARVDEELVSDKKSSLKDLPWKARPCPGLCGDKSTRKKGKGEKGKGKGRGKGRGGGGNSLESAVARMYMTGKTITINEAFINDLGVLLSAIPQGQIVKTLKQAKKQNKAVEPKTVCNMVKKGFCYNKLLERILRDQSPTKKEITDASDEAKKTALAEKLGCSIPAFSRSLIEEEVDFFCSEPFRKKANAAIKDKTVSLCAFKRYNLLCKPKPADVENLKLTVVSKFGADAVYSFALAEKKKELVKDNAAVLACIAEADCVDLLNLDNQMCTDAYEQLDLTKDATKAAGVCCIMRRITIDQIKHFKNVENAVCISKGLRAFLLKEIEKTDPLSKMDPAKFKKNRRHVAAAITRRQVKDLKLELMIVLGALCGEPDTADDVRRYLMTEVVPQFLSSINPAQPYKALTPGLIRSIPSPCLSDFTLRDCENYDAEADEDGSMLDFCIFLCNNRANKKCLSPNHLRESANICMSFFQDDGAFTEETLADFPSPLLPHVAEDEMKKILDDKALFTAAYPIICAEPLSPASVRQNALAKFKVHINDGGADKWSEEELENLSLCLSAVTDEDMEKIDLEKGEAVMMRVAGLMPDPDDDKSMNAKCFFKQLPKDEKKAYDDMFGAFIGPKNMKLFKRVLRAGQAAVKAAENDANPKGLRRRKRNADAITYTCEILGDMTAEQRKALTDDELKTISAEEAKKCLLELGDTEWTKARADIIYNKLKTKYPFCKEDGKTRLENQDILNMNKLLISLTETDIDCMTLDVNTFPQLAASVAWSEAQAKKLFTKGKGVEPDPPIPTPLTLATISSISGVICGAPDKDIADMTAAEFKKAVGTLSSLTGCPSTFYTAVVTKAKTDDVFGPVSTWTDAEFKLLGSLAAGLSAEDMKSIKTEGVLDGLSEEAISAMPASTLNAMSPEMVKNLPQTVLSSISEEQLEKMDPSLKTAVESGAQGVEEKEDEEEPANEATTGATINVLLLTSLMLLVANRLW